MSYHNISDVNECLTLDGGCESKDECQNKNGGYSCDCSRTKGHVLFNEDGVSNYTIPSNKETGLMYKDVLYIGHTCVRK